jgi:molybdate transport system substrate-binding protein
MSFTSAPRTRESALLTAESGSFALSIALIAAFFIPLLLFCAGCRPSPPANGVDEQITVAAAANLNDAFRELGKAFTSKTGVRVVFSFGATANIATQIEHGAPFDVFAAADVEHVDALVTKGLIVRETRAVFARGHLVLWAPPRNPIELNGLDDVARPEVRLVAIAQPEIAPYGRAAVEALHSANLWDAVQSKIVYAQNVAEVRQYAVSGNADLAFLPQSLIPPGEGSSLEVDPSLYSPIDQAIGVVSGSDKQEPARRFVEFVTSAGGKLTLERYGYGRPGSK